MENASHFYLQDCNVFVFTDLPQLVRHNYQQRVTGGLVTGRHSTRMGLFSWLSLWRSGLERVAVWLHKTAGPYPSLELVTGKVGVIPSQLPKGPNRHHSEKIRIPNEESFTVAFALSASLLLLLVISTPLAFCRTSRPITPYSTRGWQSLLTD